MGCRSLAGAGPPKRRRSTLLQVSALGRDTRTDLSLTRIKAMTTSRMGVPSEKERDESVALDLPLNVRESGASACGGQAGRPSGR